MPVTVTGKFHLMLNHVHSPALLLHLVDMCVIELHLEETAWCNRHIYKVIAGLEGVRKIVDDILIYAPSQSILKKRTRAFLDHCRLHGVKRKRTKSQRAVTEVDLGGFRLPKTGIQTSPDQWKSIMAFPQPGRLTDLRLWISQPP